jgi:hypothetical protein
MSLEAINGVSDLLKMLQRRRCAGDVERDL